MFGSSASGLHPEQRRSPRFLFDSLVRLTASRLGKEAQVWGRSTDLCREGIGVTVTGELTPEELVATAPFDQAHECTRLGALLQPSSLRI
jgi:hypothetical protein